MENLKLRTKFNLNPSPIIHFIVNTFVFWPSNLKKKQKAFQIFCFVPQFSLFSPCTFPGFSFPAFYAATLFTVTDNVKSFGRP